MTVEELYAQLCLAADEAEPRGEARDPQGACQRNDLHLDGDRRGVDAQGQGTGRGRRSASCRATDTRSSTSSEKVEKAKKADARTT